MDTHHASTRSIFIGAAFAPFSAPSIVSLWMVGKLIIFEGKFALSDIGSYLSLIFLVGSPMAVVVTWCLGLPFVFVLRSRRALTSISVCLGALLLGALTLPVFLFFIDALPPSVGRCVALAGLGGCLGVIVGFVFCVVVRIPSRSQ